MGTRKGGKKMGRPRLGKNVKGRLVLLRVDAAEARELRARARRAGHKTVSAYLRTVLFGGN